MIPELCTERVLVMDEVDGMRWSAALQQPQELTDQWGEVINRFVYGSLYEFGVFNADPHPGNYLFHEDGSVTFLDFGCVKRFSDVQVDGMRAFNTALPRGDGDPDALKQVLIDLRLLPRETALTADRIFEWYTPMYRGVLEHRTSTFTPEFAAFVVHRNFDPLARQDGRTAGPIGRRNDDGIHCRGRPTTRRGRAELRHPLPVARRRAERRRLAAGDSRGSRGGGRRSAPR